MSSRYLLDTHLLVWMADDTPRFSAAARARLNDPDADILFSVASLWEIVLKAARRPHEFRRTVGELRSGALQAGFTEIPIRFPHVSIVSRLPPIHGDPFDRILIAQAGYEQAQLLTVDRKVVAYGDPVVDIS